jgi:hypothetical protein
MTAVLVVAAIAVAGAVVARVTWRRPADERHSIQTHQQTLETLRAMADRRPTGVRERPAAPTPADAATPARSPKIRPGTLPASPPRPDVAPPPPVRPGSVRAPGRVRAPAPATPNGNGHHGLVFDDAAPPARADAPPAISATALSRSMPRSRRGHRRGLAPRSRRGGRMLPVMVAVVVLGAVVGVALALAPAHHVPTAQHGTSHRPQAPSHAKHSHTTVTTAARMAPTSSTANTAAYGAPSTPYTVALQATGLCWVEATETSTGAVVWTGTLTPGQSRSIPTTGSLLLRIGAANDIAVTLNGEPVVFPTGFQSPFDMSFVST